ncbi:MAG: hypothetical protein A2015_06715 [Spirochaetes bacterium GWF1_31_7]|nr:MAG: hypothetical protein A2Y30_09750 [Spirochaetes bacterium GWE1_32_154]OHD46530.1 MAG: hypothetical protein A2015_06715 [Spirochaetes bacterium GWF1_31_7]OHD49339.1 MAG: hypothetical protein A2Y29_03705 [Spirochaetes bacterium GWE2_31_10]
MKTKNEIKFTAFLKRYPEKFLLSGKNSVMDGFEYFETSEYKNKPGAILSRPKAMITNKSVKDIIRIGMTFITILPCMLKNIKKNYTDMNGYLKSVKNGSFNNVSIENNNSYPNKNVWVELKNYAWENHQLIVGFTELPQEYVFSGKASPFRHALVFAQEMKKEPIEKAPELDAGIEVMRVYNSLGIATNDIANWLRKTYNVVCMANHPLGGLVDTVPLAEKAGLGAIGKHGMLITKEFGPRCRISPLFTELKLFEYTGSHEHSWINTFCSKCRHCISSCPTSAIYSESKLSKRYNKIGLKDRYENYDREKCFTSFAATMGCAVCISVCPFSKNPAIYDTMKLKYTNTN